MGLSVQTAVRHQSFFSLKYRMLAESYTYNALCVYVYVHSTLHVDFAR